MGRLRGTLAHFVVLPVLVQQCSVQLESKRKSPWVCSVGSPRANDIGARASAGQDLALPAPPPRI